MTFVFSQYHLCKLSAQIIEGKIIVPYELSITLYSPCCNPLTNTSIIPGLLNYLQPTVGYEKPSHWMMDNKSRIRSQNVLLQVKNMGLDIWKILQNIDISGDNGYWKWLVAVTVSWKMSIGDRGTQCSQNLASKSCLKHKYPHIRRPSCFRRLT